MGEIDWEAQGVFFVPWIGADYFLSSFDGIRILILGESHYSYLDNEGKEVQPYKMLTNDCIKEQVETDFTKQFWTNIATSFLGEVPLKRDKKKFWNTVSFYNYVQYSVGFGPRVRPTEQMWKDSEIGFENVLLKLKPQILMVLGYALWEKIPDLNGQKGPSLKSTERNDTWYYPIDAENKCLAFCTVHPTAGFSGKYWNKCITEVISIVNKVS